MALTLTLKEQQMLTAVIKEMNDIPSVSPCFLNLIFDSLSTPLLYREPHSLSLTLKLSSNMTKSPP